MLEAIAKKTPPKSRRERRKIEYHNKIVSAAIELFSSKGYDATGIAEVMDMADLGVGTFYNYFSGKEDLLTYIAQEFNQQIEKAVKDEWDDTQKPMEQLVKTFKILGSVLEKNKDLVKIIFLEMLRQPMFIKTVSHQQKGLLAILTAIVKAGQGNNSFRRDIIPEDVAKYLLGIYMQAILNWLADENNHFDRSFATDLDITLNGISA